MKILTTILCLMVFSFAQAQWTTDTDINTLVADSEAVDMKAVGTSNGKTYVVFWKVVPAPVNIELRLQILDADGNQTMGAEGMLISDQIPMSTFTVLWSVTLDANDNIYIGVTGTGGGDPAFVFKLDSLGNHLWNANGVNVGSGNIVTVLPLTSGETIVSWLSSTGAVMQKYDNNGTTVWPTTQTITTGSGVTAPANFFEITGGDYIAVFHLLTGGITSNLYAQRYDASGDAQWTNAVQISAKSTAFNRSYEGVQNGDVVYMAYFGPDGSRFDSYVQRINPDGSLPWGTNGADFSTNTTDNEMSSSIAINDNASAIYVVANYSDGSQNMKGEYIQKFDPETGARMFTETAKEIYAIGDEKVHAGKLHLLNNQPWFLIKNGFDNGVSPVTLEAIYLDSDGAFVWPEETRPLATFAANKSRIHYTAPANGQSVTVFVEDKGNGSKIYGQSAVEEVLRVDDISKSSMVYTNPVNDIFTLESSSAIDKISIYNLLGQLVFHSIYNNENNIVIHTENWTSGLYLMTVSTKAGKSEGLKLVKQ